MNLPEIETLVADLLATGQMNEDTTTDLGRILAEAKAGESHADDLDYLRALHARVLASGEAGELSGAATPGAPAEDLRAEVERLRTELAEAHRTIAELKAQLTPVG